MLILFTLVMARVAGLFLAAPVLSRAEVPRRFRTLLIASISVMLLPVAQVPDLPSAGYSVAAAIVGELAFGYALGFLARLLLTSFLLAGSIVSFQMGFAMARTFDPSSGTQSPVIATIYAQMVSLIFLLMDGHHLLIRGLAASFETVPIASSLQSGYLLQVLATSSGQMYEVGARVAGPVTGLMLLINATVGFLNRTVPQLSIFNIGFPITVMSGLTAVLFALPGVGTFFLRALSEFETNLSFFVQG